MVYGRTLIRLLILATLTGIVHYFVRFTSAFWFNEYPKNVNNGLHSKKLLEGPINPILSVEDRIEFVNFDKFSDYLSSNVTLVSAVYDIYRVGRPVSQYYDWFRRTLFLDSPFVIFTELKSKDKIKKCIPSNKKAVIVTIEINDLPLFQHFDLVVEIMKSKVFKRKIERPENLEAINPLYPLVIFSKFEFLNITANLLNPFKSKKFIWIDAGMSRFYSSSDLKKTLTFDGIPDDLFTVVFENRAYSDTDFKTHNRQRLIWTNKCFIQAGIMAMGNASLAHVINKEIKDEWVYMLSRGAINTEQIALLLVIMRRPELFYLYDKHHVANWSEVLKFLV